MHNCASSLSDLRPLWPAASSAAPGSAESVDSFAGLVINAAVIEARLAAAASVEIVVAC